MEHQLDQAVTLAGKAAGRLVRMLVKRRIVRSEVKAALAELEKTIELLKAIV